MKSTEQLHNRIRDSRADDLSFLEDPDFHAPSIAAHLNCLLSERNLTVQAAIAAMGLDRSYGYQLFNGNRTPTRLFLIRLSALLDLDGEETNRLLSICRRPILYPRFPEDARILFALEHHWGLVRMDALLEEIHV